MSKIVVVPLEDLETLFKKYLGKGKPSKKVDEDEETGFGEDDEETGFGEDDEEAEDEVTVDMVKELVAGLVKKKKDEQVKKAFAALKCKPSISAVPESKLKPLYDKLKAIK
jgi:hypothetical protein